MPSTYLTKSGYERLHAELQYLRSVKRQEVASILRDSNGGADSDGDISPEYNLARDQQAFIEGRIQELELLLSDPDFIENHILYALRMLRFDVIIQITFIIKTDNGFVISIITIENRARHVVVRFTFDLNFARIKIQGSSFEK